MQNNVFGIRNWEFGVLLLKISGGSLIMRQLRSAEYIIQICSLASTGGKDTLCFRYGVGTLDSRLHLLRFWLGVADTVTKAVHNALYDVVVSEVLPTMLFKRMNSKNMALLQISYYHKLIKEGKVPV